jgi:hypothetical protein
MCAPAWASCHVIAQTVATSVRAVAPDGGLPIGGSAEVLTFSA